MIGGDFYALKYVLSEVTISAGLSCVDLVGRGERNESDAAAVRAMRKALNALPISGRVVIGEGERDKAPMLHMGEVLGAGGLEIDIAVDPLEGTNLCAEYKNGSIAVLAAAKRGNMLSAPDMYMEKLCVGKNVPSSLIDLDTPIEEMLEILAYYNKKNMNELVISVLKRDRHEELISRIRSCGARVKLIDDGDIIAVLEVINDHIDMYAGIGGSPEGVIAAAAVSCAGGRLKCRLYDPNGERSEYTKRLGITDLSMQYSASDMVKGETIFTYTSITDTTFSSGIKAKPGTVECCTHILTNGDVRALTLNTVR